MKTTVLDSYALLAYFEREDGWDTAAQLLADTGADRRALYGCVIHWGKCCTSQSAPTALFSASDRSS